MGMNRNGTLWQKGHTHFVLMWKKTLNDQRSRRQVYSLWGERTLLSEGIVAKSHLQSSWEHPLYEQWHTSRANGGQWRVSSGSYNGFTMTPSSLSLLSARFLVLLKFWNCTILWWDRKVRLIWGNTPTLSCAIEMLAKQQMVWVWFHSV